MLNKKDAWRTLKIISLGITTAACALLIGILLILVFQGRLVLFENPFVALLEVVFTIPLLLIAIFALMEMIRYQ